MEFVWGGFSVITAAYNNNMKTSLDAGITPIYGTRYLLSKYNLFNITIILCIGYLMVSLIKNNVTIRVTRSLSAGVCKLICRYFSSTAPQRLNAKDMAWLVGFVEGDGWFSITKNGIYCKYEFGIEVSKKDIKLLYKLKEMLGVGRVSRRRTREGIVLFKLTSKAHLRNIVLPIFDSYPMFTSKHWDYII